MVVLNKIYTRTGDNGTTALGDGRRVAKNASRIEAFGTVDEANAAIGVARTHLWELAPDATLKPLDTMLERIQNDLFDLGADLCVPQTQTKPEFEPLRIVAAQVDRLETEIDAMNGALTPLRSFVLPAGTPAAAALHVARTIVRRAERRMVELAAQDTETVGAPALTYINRLSDFLFVASRFANLKAGDGDVLWTPGANR
ncbi:MAG: cob(I)yrinic acid a,c-diamide adenosyltransferase [Hyphomicrobiales bacterium]